MSNRKKGLIALVGMVVLMIILVAVSGGLYNGLSSIGQHTVVPTGNSFTAGEYEGVALGKGGDLTVKVTLSDTAMEKVEVTSQNETAGIADPALETLPQAIVDAQSVFGVDDVSGATITSHAIKEAVADALAKAGVDARELVASAAPAAEAATEGAEAETAAAAEAETTAAAEAETTAATEEKATEAKATEAAAEEEATEAAADAAAPAETEAAAEEAPAAAGALSFSKPGTYTATENSPIGGDVKVTGTFAADKIEDIKVESNETPEIGGAAMDTMTKQVLDEQTITPDAVSGATLSSTAYLAALKDLAAQAGMEGAEAAPAEEATEAAADAAAPAETEAAEEATEAAAPAETEAATEEAPAAAGALSFSKPGTYTATGAGGIGGDVELTGTFTADKIEKIEINANETPEIGGAAMDKMTQQVIDEQTITPDAVSGATLSSTAYLAALKDLAAQAGLEGAEAAAAETETEAAEATEAAVEEKTTEKAAQATGASFKIAESGTGVTATSAEDWADKFPLEYNSFLENNNNDEVVDYLEEDPYLKTLYEGYGFAISYGSARGHTYDIEDLYATGRPHKLANCFTCKTSDFTAKVLSEGDSAYAMAFDDFKSEVQDPFGCFHCHENEPGQMYVTHGYLADSLGDDIEDIPAEDLSCAQCHTDYFFDPKTKATTIPHTSLATANPTDMLEYQNALVDENGDMFADWVDEDTGVRKLKAQHPEFQTYVNGSVHYNMGLTCADCHMAKRTAEDGTEYTSHYWISPLKDEDIMEGTCAKCHDTKTLPAMVQSIEDATRERENTIGNKLADIDGKLAAAVKEGKMSDDDLEELRLMDRNAQWYFDFVYVENSEGFHNKQLTNDTLDKAEELADELLTKLA